MTGKKLILILGAGALALCSTGRAATLPDAPPNVSEAFVQLPALSIDMLNRSMRRDLLDYYAADTLRDVKNTLDGVSHLARPLTDDYLQVQLTPVSRLTLRRLMTAKGPVFMTLYTVGDSLQAADTEVAFYDRRMQPLAVKKHLSAPRLDDFIDSGVKGAARKELRELVPFVTVEYIVEPEGEKMTARLTACDYLSLEAREKIEPYLRDVNYRWTGTAWKKEKILTPERKINSIAFVMKQRRRTESER